MKRTGIQGNVLPVMFGFMMMALVDVVGLTSNYVRAEFGMSDTIANLLSSACYIWFLAFSIPTGLAMNRYGRKKLVITSLLVSVAALALPVAFRGSLTPVVAAFCLMGIANTIMMTSLNPLVRDIVPADKLAGTLTLGQFFKSLASMGAPLLMPLVAASFMGWRGIFAVFAVIAAVGAVWLWLSPVPNVIPSRRRELEGDGGDAAESGSGKSIGVAFLSVFKLLADKKILLFFLAIVALVGVDIGVNVTFPRLLMEKCGMTLDAAAEHLSAYFVGKTIAALVGALLLMRLSADRFFVASSLLAAAGLTGMLFFTDGTVLTICVVVFGAGFSNLFTIIFSKALNHLPQRANEVSALMVAGFAGTAVVVPVLGMLTDRCGTQIAAIALLLAVWLYIVLTPLGWKQSKH